MFLFLQKKTPGLLLPWAAVLFASLCMVDAQITCMSRNPVKQTEPVRLGSVWLEGYSGW